MIKQPVSSDFQCALLSVTCFSTYKHTVAGLGQKGSGSGCQHWYELCWCTGSSECYWGCLLVSYHSSPGKMAYRTVLAYSLAALLLSDTSRNYPILPYLSSLIQRVAAEGMINSACCLPQSLVLLQHCHLPSLLFCALEKERCWVLQIPMAALADHVSTPPWWRQACWPYLRWLPSPSGDHTCMLLEANAKLLNLSLSILLLKEESSLKGNSSSQLLFGILFRGMG